MQAKAKKGEYPFGVTPFGFTKDENDYLIENKKRIEILKYIYQLYIIDNLSEVKVQKQIKEKYNVHFSSKYISELLDKQIYKGTVTVGGKVFKVVDPLFSPNEKMKLKNRKQIKFVIKHSYQFQNKVYMDVKVYNHTKKIKNNKEYTYYFKSCIYVNEQK